MHVGKHLFKKCIQHYLQGKTVVLATHQLQYLKDVDKIIRISQGQIQIFQNYEKLLEDYPEYQNLLVSEHKKSNPETISNTPRKISRQLTIISKKVTKIFRTSASTRENLNFVYVLLLELCRRHD